MTGHFNGRIGTETLPCDVIVVFNIATSVFLGEGFGSKHKSYFTWEMAGSPAVERAIFSRFSLLFCQIAGLQRSIVKLQIVSTPSLLTAS